MFDIVDSSFGGNYSQAEALRCIQIGLQCVQEIPSNRPTMSTIVLMLNSYSVSVHAPSRPAFLSGYSRTKSVDEGKMADNTEESSQSTTKSIYTPNELSITELDIR